MGDSNHRSYGTAPLGYDGPHCAYSLGPVRFFKMWGSCTKCEGEK